jgi:flavin reductase (DIM6/NTAB) family NADH-FMN oxidoreductase RutF
MSEPPGAYVARVGARSTPSVPPRAFRDCVGEFATGVNVVTAERDGHPAGMTLNAFTSVSLEPLLILVSLGHGSRTLGATIATRRFAVSILHRGQRDVAIAFADRGGPFPTQHVERSADGFLVVRGAAATIHCEVADVVRAGDHDLVLGEVVSITHHGGEPLLFHRGRFGGLETDAIVPPGHPISLDEGAGW